MLTNDPRIASDILWLLQNDKFFKQHFPNDFSIERQSGEGGMAGLIRIVIGQQVSTAAAKSLWVKFTAQFDPSNPQPILDADDETLRACGLSRQKIGYVRGLATAILDKSLQPETWNDKSSADIIKDITALKGFGLWSAQMFLMFNLARPDIWPHGDLGIQIGIGKYLKMETRPTEKETLAAQYYFKNRETAAALLLWSLKDGGV